MSGALRLAALVAALTLFAAVPAAAHDCSSQGDCEETTGYVGGIATIGGIIAIITGILGTQLGGGIPGAGTATLEPPSVKPAGPPIDPFTGKPLPTWEPGKYGPGADGRPGEPGWVWWGGNWVPPEQFQGDVGRLIFDPWSGKPLVPWELGRYHPGENGQQGEPGWVWFGGNWVPPDEARERIREGVDADERRARESREFADESTRRSQEWMEERTTYHENEAAKERKQRELEDELNRIRDAAGHLGDDEIWRRATEYSGTDGKLDEDWIRNLKETMRRRLGREPNPPEEPPGNWIWEGTTATLKNPLVRIGIGIATGGYSEAVYLTDSAWDNMQRRFDELDKQGKTKRWDLTEAFGAGMGGAIRERLPLNTYTTLTQNPNATWWDLGTSVGLDVFTTMGGVSDVRNIAKSVNLMGRGNFKGAINATADPLNIFGKGTDPAKWPGRQLDEPLHIPKNIKGMEPGSSIRHAEDFGMTPKQLDDARRISETHNARIDLRPPKQATIDRLAQGDNPKPAWVKAKTVGDDDVAWGAPPGERGRVVHYEPKKPTDPALMDEYNRRLKQFQDNDAAIGKLEQQGLVFRDKNGVLRDPMNSKPFTGDIDTFDIKVKKVDPDGTVSWVDPSPELHANIVDDMANSSMRVQHPDQMHWTYDPSKGSNAKIDSGVLGGHAPGETPLMRVEPGGPPRTTYYEGPVDRSQAMQEAWNNVKGEVRPKFYEEGFIESTSRSAQQGLQRAPGV